MTGVVNPKEGFSYDLPTQWSDGTPLLPEQIEKFQVGFGQTPGNYTLVKDDAVLETGKQLSPISLASGLAYGQWYSAVRTVAKAAFGGKTSVWSNEAAFVLDAPAPKAPVNFTIV